MYLKESGKFHSLKVFRYSKYIILFFELSAFLEVRGCVIFSHGLESGFLNNWISWVTVYG